MHIPLCCVTSTAKVDFEDIEEEQYRQGLERRQYVWDIEEASLPQEVAYNLDWHKEYRKSASPRMMDVSGLLHISRSAVRQ